jgi:hypothetical protein
MTSPVTPLLKIVSIVLGPGITGSVKHLVRAASDDFFLDLGGAAEDQLDGQVLEAGLWDCWTA